MVEGEIVPEPCSLLLWLENHLHIPDAFMVFYPLSKIQLFGNDGGCER